MGAVSIQIMAIRLLMEALPLNKSSVSSTYTFGDLSWFRKVVASGRIKENVDLHVQPLYVEEMSTVLVQYAM